jgi:hypothetical protein
MPIAKIAAVAALLGAGLILGGCVEVPVHLSDDFGVSVKQDVAAHIADPDAHYTGDPAPGATGTRVEMAQDRYNKGKVTPPASTSTSSASTGGGSGGSGGSPQ